MEWIEGSRFIFVTGKTKSFQVENSDFKRRASFILPGVWQFPFPGKMGRFPPLLPKIGGFGGFLAQMPLRIAFRSLRIAFRIVRRTFRIT